LPTNLELDWRAYEPRRSGQPIRLSRIPMELLFLLVERRGELITRDEIVARTLERCFPGYGQQHQRRGVIIFTIWAFALIAGCTSQNTNQQTTACRSP
jgi:hypothetical protein